MAVPSASCIMGPDYKRPAVVTPTEFRFHEAATEATSVADLPWWGVFNDQALQSLISEALTNNYDLQIAVARIEQARESVVVAHSEALPQLNYSGDVGREKTFVPGGQSGNGGITYSFASGLINAAWEPDLWGRIRRSTEAAEANLLAQEYVRRGVMLTLVTDLAADYFRLLELDRELAIAEESTRVYRQTLDLFTLRFQAGRDSQLPTERASAAYESSLARAKDLTRAIAQQENAISILTGVPPRSIVRGVALTQQTMPETPIGTTTALLQRRPDILQAEQAMISANAQIGVAVANYFPRIGLSALAGGEWAGLQNFSSGFGVWSAALSLTGPIFTGGRLRAEYRARQAFWDETVASYRRTVLVAFQETSDALIAQQTLIGRRAQLENQVAALRRSSDLALLRYDSGRASYFEVLEAQQQLFPAEDELAQAQRDQLVAVVNLYKSLGGGWNLTPADWKSPH